MPTDYTLDHTPAAALAVCAHCHERLMRATPAAAEVAITAHLYAMHRADRKVRDRIFARQKRRRRGDA